jgi:thiamine transporter ThiT
LAQTFSKKHLAGSFQKTFGGKISKNIWQGRFGGNILAGKLKYFFHFENSTKCSFLK